MKTITYNPETHKLVPIEPTTEMMAVMSGEWHPSRQVGTRKQYLAMLNAAPAAKEAPQQDEHYRCDDPECIVCCPTHQPATHGEPVAWMCSDAALVRMGYSKFSKDCSGAWNTPVYTSPPPTPEHIKAMQQALEALETDDWQKKMQASIDLKNAMKGST